MSETPIDVTGTFEQITLSTIQSYCNALAAWEKAIGTPATAEQSLALLTGILNPVLEKVYEYGMRIGLDAGAALAQVPEAMVE